MVDDRPEGLLALEAVLEAPEHNLITARSGQEALRWLLREDFAVILLDVQMPGLDGFETAGLIRRRQRSRDIPIIFLTAISKDEHFVARGYEVGAVDYLCKPFEPGMLKSKVGVFVELHRKNTQIRLQAELLRQVARLDLEHSVSRLEIENLQRYRYLLDAIANLVWRTLPDRSAEYLNAAWVAYTGLSLAESAGLGWLQAIDVTDRLRLLNLWASSDRGFELEVRIERRSDCSWRWHLLRVTPEQSGAEIKSWLLAATDVDDRRKIEGGQRFLAHAGTTLSATLDYAGTLESVLDLAVPMLGDVGMLHLHRDTSAQGANSDEPIPVGVHAEPIPDGPLGELRVQDAPLALARVLASGKTELVSDVEVPDDEGVDSMERKLWRSRGVRSFMCVPLIGRGQVRGALTLLARERRMGKDDVSLAEEFARRATLALDNARMYHEAQRAVGVRDEFLSIASHELKTPLSSLLLHIQLLRRLLETGESGRAKIGGRLEALDRQMTRMAALIDNLFDVTRIKNQQLELKLEETDLAQLVGGVASRLREQARAADVELVLLADEAVLGRWDRVGLEQVAINLLSNAIKYGAGRPVEVRIFGLGEVAELSVRDRGVGIAREDQGRIFDRFERAVSARSFEGLGLGLYIVKQIVTAHEGQIDVQSVTGQGATFTVRLPRRRMPRAHAVRMGG